jgi:hypothetical protein
VPRVSLGKSAAPLWSTPLSDITGFTEGGE